MGLVVYIHYAKCFGNKNSSEITFSNNEDRDEEEKNAKIICSSLCISFALYNVHRRKVGEKTEAGKIEWNEKRKKKQEEKCYEIFFDNINNRHQTIK